MRLVLPLLVLATPFALPARADTLLAASQVTAVTIYAQGARVTREVSFAAPAGRHQLRIADLPAGVAAELIRLQTTDGTVAGAFSLRETVAGPDVPPANPDLDARIATAEAARDTALRALGEIDARIAAAEAQADFLSGADLQAEGQPPADLAALAAMIGQQVQAARLAALEAATARPAAQMALDAAETRLAALYFARDDRRAQQSDRAELTVAINQAAAGDSRLTITHFIEAAAWRPAYTADLTRGAAPSVVLARDVLVTQESGEDWYGVQLTLSTARPLEQAEPSQLWPELRRVEPPQPDIAYDAMARELAEPLMAAAPMVEAEAAMPVMEGDVLAWQAPAPADVASGVEDLRIPLGSLTFAPQVEARAVPRRDASAFVVASFENGPEVLLPGPVVLSREGAIVGMADLELTPAGAKVEVPFGAIDGLRLTREMPRNSEGDAGFFSSATARSEVALIRVENLTGESWPVHLLDQVPYSEQTELEITYSAEPPPAETDPEGKRGLLGWRFDLAPGAKQEIRLETQLRWPEGLELR